MSEPTAYERERNNYKFQCGQTSERMYLYLEVRRRADPSLIKIVSGENISNSVTDSTNIREAGG